MKISAQDETCGDNAPPKMAGIITPSVLRQKLVWQQPVKILLEQSLKVLFWVTFEETRQNCSNSLYKVRSVVKHPKLSWHREST